MAESAAFAGVLGVGQAGAAITPEPAAARPVEAPGSKTSKTEVDVELRCETARACDEVKTLIERKRLALSGDFGARLIGLGPLIDALTIEVHGASGAELSVRTRGPTEQLAETLGSSGRACAGACVARSVAAAARSVAAETRIDSRASEHYKKLHNGDMSMGGANVLDINDLNFETEVLKSSVPFLLDFSATWCGPCKVLSPIVDKLADELQGKVRVGKLDIDDSPGVTTKFGIRGVPTVLVFKAWARRGRPSRGCDQQRDSGEAAGRLTVSTAEQNVDPGAALKRRARMSQMLRIVLGITAVGPYSGGAGRHRARAATRLADAFAHRVALGDRGHFVVRRSRAGGHARPSRPASGPSCVSSTSRTSSTGARASTRSSRRSWGPSSRRWSTSFVVCLRTCPWACTCTRTCSGLVVCGYGVLVAPPVVPGRRARRPRAGSRRAIRGASASRSSPTFTSAPSRPAPGVSPGRARPTTGRRIWRS